MKIHTFVYNDIDINLQKIIIPCVIWNYNLVLQLLELKYVEWVVYFKRLVLNKSRENLLKYILIKEFGGIFINIELLKLFDDKNINEIKQLINSEHQMCFWLNEYQDSFILDIFDVNKYLLNDDIFYISNNSNSFVNYLLEQIDKSIIPTNEYQNKIYLGNIFLSIELDKFYQTNFLLCLFDLNNSKKWINNLFSTVDLKSKYDHLEVNENKFEKSIYFIRLEKNFTFDIKYKLKVYPNIPELVEPESKIISFQIFFTAKKYLKDILFILIFQYWNSWLIILLLVFLDLVINFLIKQFTISVLDVYIKKTEIDSITLFYHRKYKFLKELQKNWKIIQSEAIDLMLNAPKLNISRTINDWYDSKTYIEQIKNKHGWIRSWSYDPEVMVENQLEEGNYEWLNYGIIYFGDDFSENTKYCPKTFEILNKIKKYINICGFSWMRGGCILQPHKDITGIQSGSLAMHLGLDIPNPENSCKLVIKNLNDEYTYINEENGKMFIFDATYEHYAYNLSNANRLILYMDFKCH
jgi:hypothetical protein